MGNSIFGTDGIRGVANKHLTADLSFFMGKAFAVYLLQDENNKKEIVIGKDTRISGDMIVTSFCAGVMSMGINVTYVGILPTPALSFLTKKLDVCGGVMVTASHNSYEYNGIKLFDKNGQKISIDSEKVIQNILTNIQAYLPDEHIGKLNIDLDLCKLWADYLIQELNVSSLNKYKIVVDCANGASYRVVPYVLKTLGAVVDEYNVNSSGEDINSLCGTMNIQFLINKINELKYDIGFAYDGDADRVCVVTKNGSVLSGDDLIYIFATYMQSKCMLNNNRVVCTIMSNFGLEKSLEDRGINIERVPVGDRNVVETMLKFGCNLGGEDSGHIILRDYNNSADGLLATLFLLKILQENQYNLDDLLKDMQKYNTIKLDLKVTERQKIVVQNGKLDEIVQQYSDELGENGRLVVRASGTECVVRVMIEGEDLELITKIAEQIERIINAL